jgi:3-hydroxybutyrate dehydrogenase
MDETKTTAESKKGRLSSRVAIVTGSTSGIGLGIARALAAEGCNIVMSGSRERKSGDAVDELQKEFKSIKVAYCQADLSKLPSAAESLINTAVKEFGRLDILVNNAGQQFVSPLEEFPAEQWDKLIAINLSSAFHTMKLAIPLMKKNERKWGRIVNISSVQGIVASIHKAAYVASKHGLNGLTKVAALETAADTEITCNAICPGWVHTPLVQAQIEANAKKAKVTEEQATVELLSKKQPRPRFAKVEDIGAYAVFLCSDAGNNITGATQLIDGAWSTQ